MPQEFTAALVKGRGNYISLRRLEGAGLRAGGMFTHPDDFDSLSQIKQWAGRTDDGSRSDLDFRPPPAVWEAVQSDHGNCLGKKCRTYKDCFYFAARRRMNTANLLIVNHALFMTDLALRGRGANLLPDYDVAIFDEAHNVEAVAAEHLGLRISQSQVEYLLGRLYHPRTHKGLLAYYDLDEAIAQLQHARSAADDFFDGVADQVRRRGSANGRLRNPVDVADSLGEELRKLATLIGREAEGLDEDEERVELASAADKCEALASGVTEWLGQRLPDTVYWVDLQSPGGRPRITLAAAPIDVGPILRRDLFDRVPTCVLTSATLAVGKPPSFAFAKGMLGLTKCESLAAAAARSTTPKPGDDPRPRNLPDPSTEPRDSDAAAITRHPALPREDGRSRASSSSPPTGCSKRPRASWRRGSRAAISACSSRGRGCRGPKMIEAFKADVGERDLRAPRAPGKGSSVPGEALSNVIIVRLPFSVPDHPAAGGEARKRSSGRGRRPVPRLPAPRRAASLKLKQGFPAG